MANLMMSRRDNLIEKQIKKIEKSEEKALKLLMKQRKDLMKALEDNEKLIYQKLSKGTPSELKLEAEMEKMAKKLESLRGQVDEIRSKREKQIIPLRERSAELKEKLKNVENQIDHSENLRLRRQTSESSGLSSGSSVQNLNCSVSMDSPSGLLSYPESAPPPAYSTYWHDE